MKLARVAFPVTQYQCIFHGQWEIYPAVFHYIAMYEFIFCYKTVPLPKLPAP